MADSAPSTDTGRSRERKLSWLRLNSGAVLFICAFLPAVDACDDPVYPIEFAQHPFGWPLLLPYLLGLLAAVGAAKQLFLPASNPRRWHIATIVIAFMCYVAATLVYALSFLESPAIAAIPMVLCCLLLRPALAIFNPRALSSWRYTRATWVGAAVCTIHFGIFIALYFTAGDDSDDPLRSGLCFSFASALVLAVAAYLSEQQLEPPPPPEPPPLPRARLRKPAPP